MSDESPKSEAAAKKESLNQRAIRLGWYVKSGINNRYRLALAGDVGPYYVKLTTGRYHVLHQFTSEAFLP